MHGLKLTVWIFLLTLAIFSCDKTPVEAPNAAPDKRLPNAPANLASWQADSARLWQLWKQYWYYDDNYLHDSAIAVCRQVIQLGEGLMAFRFDSSLYEKYAKAHAGIGYNLMEQGQLDEALQWSLAGYRKIQEKFGEDHIRNTEICVGIAFNYVQRGDYKRGLEYLFKSLDIMNRIFDRNHPYFGNDYENLGVVYELMGNSAEAEKWYRLALENFRQTKPHETGIIYTDLARLFLGSQNYEKAIQYALEALKINEHNRQQAISGFTGVISSGRPQDIVRPYTFLGTAYRETGRLPLAVNCLQKGISEGLKFEAPAYDFLSECLTELGITCQSVGQPQKALDAFRQAIEYRTRHSGAFHPQIGNIWLKIAGLHEQEADYNEALQSCQMALKNRVPAFSWKKNEALPAPADLPAHPVTLAALQQKAAIFIKKYQQSGDVRQLNHAQFTSECAAQLIRKMNRSYRSDISKQTLSSRAQPVFETGIVSSMLLNRAGGALADAQKAFEYAEQAKATALLDRIRRENITSFAGVPPETVQAEEQLHRELAFLDKTIQEMSGAQSDSLRLWSYHKKLTDLRNRHDSLLQQIAIQFPEYFQLKFNPANLRVSDIQQKLPAHTALLEYVFGDSILYTFCLTATSLSYQMLPIDSGFTAALAGLLACFNPHWSDQVSTHISNFGLPYITTTAHQRRPAVQASTAGPSGATFAQFADPAQQLYRQLVQPVLPENTKQLIIIPDGPLGYLPFQILLEKAPDPEALAAENWRDLPYLVKTKDIRYEYSAALLLENQPRRKRKRLYAGFAPAFTGQPLASRGLDSAVISRAFPDWRGGALPDLKHNRPEIQAVAGLVGGQPCLGNAATESRFKNLAPGSGILHLATHACADDQDPLHSQILFTPTPGDTANDGALHAFELYNMRLDAELAVLSACQTGAGRLQRGEGVMSLSRAFKYAGCPNIVMSLWNADDAASKDIILGFFKNLKSGQGKDQALCAAQRDFLKNATLEQAHPSRWATFVLIGDDAPMAFGSEIWLVAALTLAICGLVIYLFFGRAKA